MATRSRPGRNRSGFGDFTGGTISRFALVEANSQEDALEMLARQAAPDTMNPKVRNTAIKIVRSCDARDDICELTAIFEAVKNGDSQVKGLADGLKYMSDNFFTDTFIAPSDLLDECEDGACAGDCDDHAGLCFALAGALGFRVGLRAWGPKGSKGFQHVYAVALVPKEEEDEPYEFGLDTSADAGESSAGWQPPEGHVLTAWMEPGDVPSNGTVSGRSTKLSDYRHRR